MTDRSQPDDDPFAPPPAGWTGSLPGIPGDVPPPPPPPPPPPAYGAAPVGSYPPPYSGVPAPYGSPVVAPQNGTGTAALILGILALTCCGPFTGIVAIVLGRRGMTLADQGLATNRGLAQAGFILGIIGTALSVLVFVVSLATGTFTSTSGSLGP